MKDKYDITFVGVGVNPEAAGKNNKYYNFLESVGAKFLYNEYYDSYTTEPMALLHLAAQVEKSGYKANIVDGIIQNLEKREIVQALIKLECTVFAFTMFDTSEEDVCEIIREIKKYKPTVVCITGGTYPTIEYKKILHAHPEINYITIGDGDYVYQNFLYAIQHKKPLQDVKNLAFRNGCGEIILTEIEVANLDDLAYTDRRFAQSVIDKGFSLGLNTTRGCAHGACSFCYLKDYQTISCQPKIRYRANEKIIDELNGLIEKYHIDKITFCDDDFFGTDSEGINRACELFERIVKNGIKLKIYVIGRLKTIQYLIRNNMLSLMKEAGVSCIYLGFDSYNEDILIRYKKGFSIADIDEVINTLHAKGIRINPGLITFEPVLTIDHVKRNIELFKKLGYYDAYMFTRVLIVLPQMRELYFKGVNVNVYCENYYRDPKTKILYEKMTEYVDMILPYYRMIDRNKITEKDRQFLYEEHFMFFDSIYEELKANGNVDTTNKLVECNKKIAMAIRKIAK